MNRFTSSAAARLRFWDAVLTEVRVLPPELCREPNPFYSDATVEVSALSFQSIGDITVTGWIAAPRRQPARGIIIQFPAYATVLFPPVGFAEQGFIGVAVSVRGHHRSEISGVGFPGLLTKGLPGSETYVYRGVYADALRAVSLIPGALGENLPVVLIGQSQGAALSLVSAALVGGVRGVGAEVPFLCAIFEALAATDAFPYRELKDWLRDNPAHADEALATIDLIDVLGFVDRVCCPVLMSIGTLDPVTPVVSTRILGEALPHAEVVEYEGAGHEGGGMKHRIKQMRWLEEQMGEGCNRVESR